MGSMKLWARDGEAVRQAIEFGEIAHKALTRSGNVWSFSGGRFHTDCSVW